MISLSDFGAVGNGVTDDTNAIQQFFDVCAAKGDFGLVGPGTYLVAATVVLPPGLHIKCSDQAVFLSKVVSERPMFLNGEYEGTYTGYQANGNITIEGGIFDGGAANFPGQGNGVAIGHAEKIRFNGCGFRNFRHWHMLEISSCKNVAISGCWFDNLSDPEGSRWYSECIRIDAQYPFDGRNPTFPHFSSASADATACSNIQISDCRFTDCLTAVGSHAFSFYSMRTEAEMCENIHISNCVIESCSWDAIRAEGWRNSTISGTTVRNCGYRPRLPAEAVGYRAQMETAAIKIIDSLNLSVENIAVHEAYGNGVHVDAYRFETKGISVSEVLFSSIAYFGDAIRLDGVLRPSDIIVCNVNGRDVRNGLVIGGVDNLVATGMVFDSCAEYGVRCDATKRAYRAKFSDFTIRNTAFDNMFLHLADSDVGGGICSLPAPGKNNLTAHGCQSIAVHDIFLNGASLHDQVRISGTESIPTTGSIFRNLHLRGSAVNGINISAGAANNILFGNVVRATYSGSPVVDHGSGTLQHSNHPMGTAIVYDPPTLGDGGWITTAVTVAGAEKGDHAIATFSEDLQGLTMSAWVSAADTVSVMFRNDSGQSRDLASGNLKVLVTRV